MDYFDYVTLLKSTLAVPDLNPECVPRIGVLRSKLLPSLVPTAPWYMFGYFAPSPVATANDLMHLHQPKFVVVRRDVGNCGM